MILGKIYNLIAKIFDGIFTFLIFIVNLLIGIAGSIRQIISIFSMFLILFLLFPFLFAILLTNKYFLGVLLFMILTPWVGGILNEYFNKIRYVTSQYFYDRAKLRLEGINEVKGSLSDYSTFYDRKKEEERLREEERQRREYERRAREQQKIWEELFRQFYNQTGGGYYQTGNRQSGGYNQNTSYNSNVYNPTSDFIEKYEKSCLELGIKPTSDEIAIKKAYREMAKKYHPDVNKDAKSTEKFQRINEANEFLSGSNIERYKQLKK